MNIADIHLQHLVNKILTENTRVETRNSAVFRTNNYMVNFHSMPLVSLRKTAWKNALREWEWFMSGSNNINDLHPSVHSWWKPWADKDGRIPNNYSDQFRSFFGTNGAIDQIKYLQNGIMSQPNSRRLVATTWNSSDMVQGETPITNCHGSLIQFFVNNGKLDMTMYQRSCDVMLGLPHNWIQYWAFLTWMAHRTGYSVGGFTWIGGDVHIYDNHLDMANKIIEYDIDKIRHGVLKYEPSGEDFKADDFDVGHYNPIFKERLPMTV